jgi:rsbT co-antagonist protein RsbR
MMTTETAADLLNLYGLAEDDLVRIRAMGTHVSPVLDLFIDAFYDWMRPQPEYEEFFHDEETELHARRMQLAYWERFFEADIDESYLRDRMKVGETHARIGLPMHAYFSAMNMSFDHLLEMDQDHRDGDAVADRGLASSLAKLMHLDTALVVQAYSTVISETLAAQGKSLMEMSTPVTQVWDGILMLPVVGIIDSKRAQDVMNAILQSIAETKARNFILDISGVAVVDTAVANHLIKITKATALMGCECVISGVSPAIAQTIVELGIDVGTVRTTANLKDALAGAFQRTGYGITKLR